MAENQGQLVLAQNQYALVQDMTGGTVSVYVGPVNTPIGNNERPVVYDRKKDTYIQVSLDAAIRQNPFVPEGHYMVLENPAEELRAPKGGSNNKPIELRIGRKVNIHGPATFSLWPGQTAEVIPGHHLRSNQYLLIRVYNAEEAAKSATGILQRTAGMPMADNTVAFTPGQQIIIKGEEVSFFIPPTGFEVLQDAGANNSYVREALTLERLEYAILLDEDGNKRYERGPQVVFPTATETFLTRADQSDDGKGSRNRKFKAIELNDYMGLYIKVTADYEEEVPELSARASALVPSGVSDIVVPALLDLPPNHVQRGSKVFRQYKTGEELFITGKEQRIYYQRAEHALIGYDDPAGGGLKRERWYGITIPKGEGRYVLDKSAGAIKMVQGPKIFLPDPRNETIARRLLDPKTVDLWYPGNLEAQAFNQTLASQTNEDMGYMTYNAVSSDAATRGMNRMTASNIRGGGDAFKRSGTFTPPPTLTLGAATKYEGVPSISVWTGYAVQVVDKAGKRRVVAGPNAVLLEYDETLEVLELSTGRPKNTDDLMRTVYLRVDHNLVSDEVTVETKDLVQVKLKVSYRVNFLPEYKERWFSVENYVKYLCDHMRSLLKASMKKLSITELTDNSSDIIRDVVLGKKAEATVDVTDVNAPENAPRRHHLFQENGMDVYDVEALGFDILDKAIAAKLAQAQSKAVETMITLASNEQMLVAQRRQNVIGVEMAELGAEAVAHDQLMSQKRANAVAETALLVLEHELAEEARRTKDWLDGMDAEERLASSALARRKAEDDYVIAKEKEYAAVFVSRMAAISPQLIQALNTLGENAFMTRLTESIAPLALAQQQGLGQTLENVFAGTMLEPVLNNIKKART
jgi:major vault protein